MATLRKRKYKSGNAAWFIKDTVNGKRIRKMIGKCDKRTAEQIFNKYNKMNDLQKTKIDLRNTKISAFLKTYFEFAVATKSERTLQREQQITNSFLKYFLKNKMSEIEITNVESYRLERVQVISKETVNLEFRHLKAIFSWAQTRGYIDVNPFKAIKPFKTPESDLPRFFELEEIEIVRRIFKNDPLENLIEFYLLTGARLNETLVLTWDHIDMRRNQIKIPSLYTKAKKHRIISFENDKKLKALLTKLRHKKDNKLFGPENDKKQWLYRWVSHKISKVLTQNGFPWATCHTFRHTYISHLVMSGVPLTTVKEIVGHSSFTTTLKYAHLSTSHKK